MDKLLEQGLIEVFLKAAHPAKDGWHQLRGMTLEEDVEVDMFFYRKGESPVAVILMESPYVSASDLKLAQHIKATCSRMMNGREVKLMMVYKEPLFRPQNVPKGIYIMSITEGTMAPTNAAPSATDKEHLTEQL